MSHHGIGLSFSFGPGGRPEVTLLGDLLAHCEGCGYESGVRKYLPVPFHTLTVRALAANLSELPGQMAGACPQCESPLGVGTVSACALHYGFPAGAGVVRGFLEGESISWLLCPHDAFDVQEVPRWNPAADASRVAATRLDEPALLAAFGRPLSSKELVRRWVRSEESGVLRCGADLALVRGGADSEAAAAAADNAAVDGPWIVAPIADGSGPVEGFFGAPGGWLRGVPLGPDPLWGCAAIGGLEKTISDILQTFPIQVGIERDADTLAMILPEGEADQPRPLLGLREIAYEAARSMSSPGDIARLEIDRVLHGLTGLWVA